MKKGESWVKYIRCLDRYAKNLQYYKQDNLTKKVYTDSKRVKKEVDKLRAKRKLPKMPGYSLRQNPTERLAALQRAKKKSTKKILVEKLKEMRKIYSARKDMSNLRRVEVDFSKFFRMRA